MFRINRTISRRELVDGAGDRCALVSEQLSVTAGLRDTGVGVIYQRAVAVERGAHIAPITDVVMIARLVGLLAVTLAMIVGVIRR